MAKVFLGGVGKESTWRDEVIPRLNVTYVDPVVSEETQEDYDFLLYVITPQMQGFSLIPELIDASNKKAKKTLFCAILEEGTLTFTPHQKKSLDAIGKMVENNGGRWLKSLNEVVSFLNSYS
jgi:hypothetical protein